MNYIENVRNKIATEKVLRYEETHPIVNRKRFDKRAEILLVGDEHIGNAQHNRKQLMTNLNWAYKNGIYILHMGDGIETATRTSVGDGVYTQEQIVDEQISEWAAIYEPFVKAGLFLGAHVGNHEARAFKDEGVNLMRHMCRQIGAKYLGIGKAHLFRVGNQTYTMYTTHGSSGARLPYTKIKGALDLEKIIDVEIYCFDENTEILTKEGWKGPKEINKKDTPITFNLKSQKLEEDKILEIIHKKEEKLVHFKNRFCDFKFSPKHRMVTKSLKNNLIVDEAISMKDKVRKIIHAGNLMHAKRKYSNAEMRLFGWLISEGHFRKYGINITQDDRRIKEITKLLDNLKIKYSLYDRGKMESGKNIYNIYIYSRDAKKIKTILKSKNIPKSFFNITDEEFKNFIGTMIKGDGIKNGSGYIYYSADEQLIDELQMLCVTHNYRATKNIKKHHHGYSNKIQFELLINPKKETIINGGWKWYERTPLVKGGNVWSISTKNTTLIVRRKGKVCITGNCMGHVHQLSHHIREYYSIDKRNKKVERTKKHFILTGSYLDYWDSYGQVKCMEPSRTGSPLLTLDDKVHRINVSLQ